MKPGRAVAGFLAVPFLLMVAGLLVIAALAGGLPSTSPVGSRLNAAFNGAQVPAEYREWVIRAGQTCPEVTPQLLAAQLEQESGWNPTVVSPVGAMGIAQFMPGTWPNWSEDNDGGGVSPYHPGDAIMAAARYDCALAKIVRGYIESGRASGDVQDLMLAAYNAGPNAVLNYRGIPPYAETQNYVRVIRTLMNKYQDVTPDIAAGTPFGSAVVEFAMRQRGLPYSWGGGDTSGPSMGFGNGAGVTGFDCSSLVQYAVYHASGGKLLLPRVSQAQVTVGQEVPRDFAAMMPGDVIGFDPYRNGDYSHIGIYIGNGQMVHAPKTGDVVKVSDLSESYYANATWSVRRYG
ncbi:NlpC/P60 family protein [Yinghuangia sp. YIM S09857]|uniref:bifunctional lytic transglycosylase/C40 family peptidase n=1 Tax=Yinghuangia sp. YIM S09857 TaxID=3436929 RepID=UPI003F52D1E7